MVSSALGSTGGADITPPPSKPSSRVTLGGSAGLALAERDPDNLLDRWSPWVDVRIGWRAGKRVTILGALSGYRRTGNGRELISPCLPVADCPPIVGQPNTVLALASLVEVGGGRGPITVFARAGPMLAWWPERRSGQSALQPGLRAGGGIRFATRGRARLVASIDYSRAHRSANPAPRWWLTPAVGVEVR
jgi:hypothetical protein